VNREALLHCVKSNDPSRSALSGGTVTSGLNFTQNHRFEFAVAAAAGAVD
jgi:hypothetical protein